MNREKIKTKAYAGRLKDKEALLSSSSGGAFIALSDYVLSHKGAIACSIYNYHTSQMEFQLFTEAELRDKAKGSKYMQSIPGDIFQTCEKWVKENPEKKLLFVGMGCQAAGFLRYAEVKRFADKVFVVDIICHGSPSPLLWREYVKVLQKRYSGDINNLTFKDKRNGWKNPTASVIIKGKEVLIKEYTKIFYNKCALRPSCYKCPYATTERNVDITIGDFWGIDKVMPEFYDEKGNSLLLIHTNIGQSLFDESKQSMEYKECELEKCLQPNLIHPTECSPQREILWKDYQTKGMDYVVKKYGTSPLVKRVLGKVRFIVKRYIDG